MSPYGVDKHLGGDNKENDKYMEDCVTAILKENPKMQKGIAIAICKKNLRQKKEKAKADLNRITIRTQDVK